MTERDWINTSGSKIRTGLDIVDNKRIRKVIEKDRDNFYNKILTKNELEYIIKRNHNVESLAGIFAGKEAVSKVIGKGIGVINWVDISIERDSFGKPFVQLSPKAYEELVRTKINSLEISISHEKDYTVAFVVGFFE